MHGLRNGGQEEAGTTWLTFGIRCTRVWARRLPVGPEETDRRIHFSDTEKANFKGHGRRLICEGKSRGGKSGRKSEGNPQGEVEAGPLF